ncbi:hypothetical protein E6H16_05160 [Candidatus Bathyarchaeota archaeon]|nr:MAG: hypothetical protein E6H16_05160 [Candidatus Bathyarchaeota archaeon]
MSVKVMIAFGPQTYTMLNSEANERGVSVQELLRAVIIPEWFKVREVPRNGNGSPIEPSRIRAPEFRESSPLQRLRT